MTAQLQPIRFRSIHIQMTLALAALLVPGMAARAQGTIEAVPQSQAGFGPLDSTPPSGLTAEQVIAKFAAKESEFKAARQSYGYRQSVRVDTVNDDNNKVDGEYKIVSEVSYDNSNRRVETVINAPQNTLERILMTPSDVSDIQDRLPFVLTAEEVGKYNVTYVGRQRVDELDNYVFDVAPKHIDKGKRYFQGRIWVDQRDLQIVLASGKNVPDDLRRGHEDLSPPFTTYREQIDGKYWFPTYTKAEAILHFSGGTGYMGEDVHIREVVTYSNYKRFGADVQIIYKGQDITHTGDKQNNPNTPNSTPPAPQK
jgi:hypothetical protein